MPYVIGVDIGTQSTKALLADTAGRIVAQHSQGYQPDTPRPLWAEQDPQVWLEAVAACIAGCVAKAEVEAGEVAGLCVSSLYGGSGIPVGADMQPLHPCLIWLDRRAGAEVAEVRATVDQDRLFGVTGNGIDSYYGFTKMLWLKRNRPEIWARTRHLLPPNAWVIQQLTGSLAVDHSSAGNIGGVYDMAARTWSGEMLDALGIPRAMMPERLVESTAQVGTLLPAWAARLGLLAGTPVIAGGVDAAVATFAAGVTRPGQHVAMIGTSMCWGGIAREADARHGLVAMPHVVNGMQDLYVFGGAIAAGASVSWFQKQICRGEGGPASVAVLDAEAVSLPPGSDGIVFLPYLMGERSPVWDDQASGAFVGLGLSHTRGHLHRAVLEGVTYALQHNIEAGRQTMPQLDPALIVVGGAARSDLWMQIIADVTGFPVRTIAEDVEAALGAAILAGIGIGAVASDAGTSWVTLADRAQPAASGYGQLFTIYKDLYPALKDAMHRLQDFKRG
jgi:sugar (pentulose or hexulose) kinase